MTATIRQRVSHQLGQIYTLTAPEIQELTARVLHAAGVQADQAATVAGDPAAAIPGAAEVVLITYGNTFVVDDEPGLRSLAAFWNERLEGTFSTVHVLPFFPSSSDGGFAVSDYRIVDPSLGTWEDLAAISCTDLMVDLVCNHGSTASEWFSDFIADRVPGCDYFLTAEPGTPELALVTRPRTHPVLAPVETVSGMRHVWATFSHDQVDFDFSNPDVLVEFCAILGHYMTNGATRVRLDAIAYLWKQLGTSCVHLPETHQVVKLMRTLVEARNPSALIITETNVPHAENVSYFGAGDEAHVVYNFSLAPLIVWSVITGRTDHINSWLHQLEAPGAGRTFLNFIASHDGIGLRPIEDFISADELRPVLQAASAVGGRTSDYTAEDGPRPYELNVSLADLLAGVDGETADRFVVAHALLLAVQGIPAVYVHSLLATPGDVQTVERTGHNRDINRARVPLEEALRETASGWRGEVFDELTHLIKVRAAHTAFDPASPQIVHDLGAGIVAIERGHEPDRVLAVHNMSEQSRQVELPAGFGDRDLITGETVAASCTLDPWQARWLV